MQNSHNLCEDGHSHQFWSHKWPIEYVQDPTFHFYEPLVLVSVVSGYNLVSLPNH